MKRLNHGRIERTHRQMGQSPPPRAASRRENPKQRAPSSCVSVNVNDSLCRDREVVSSTSGKQNCSTALARALGSAAVLPSWPEAASAARLPRATTRKSSRRGAAVAVVARGGIAAGGGRRRRSEGKTTQ
eukprot:scaffold248382_cov35-Tisochrysis_lutea.AAC.1